MSDIYPITLTRYNNLSEAGLTDANKIYQIYSTEEDIAQELIRTRKALKTAVDGLEKMTWGCNSTDAEYLLKEIKEITADQKCAK